MAYALRTLTSGAIRGVPLLRPTAPAEAMPSVTPRPLECRVRLLALDLAFALITILPFGAIREYAIAPYEMRLTALVGRRTRKEWPLLFAFRS